MPNCGMTESGKNTYKIPNENRQLMATFLFSEVCNCQRKGSGKTRIKASVTILGMAFPKKNCVVPTHFPPGIVLSQLYLTGWQPKIVTRMTAVHQAINMPPTRKEAIFRPRLGKMR